MSKMLRRAGRFRKSRATTGAPSPTDSTDVLEEKWREWVKQESYKRCGPSANCRLSCANKRMRLVFALALHDSSVSTSFFVPPLITSAELTLELPASDKLWRAKTAGDWRDKYLSHMDPNDRRLPDVAACMRDARIMLEAWDMIDVGFARHIVLSMFWRQLWDCRQLSGFAVPSTADTNLASSHWQHDLTQTIQHFRMTIADVEPLSPFAALIYEHLLLNINVSFDELSRFSGKEGTQEARRVFPLLRRWAQSREARQAVWHAGQILQEATKFPPGALRNFPAIALYHGGLTLWAYGLLSAETTRIGKHGRQHCAKSAPAPDARAPSQNQDADIALLNGSSSIAVQRFIALGRGSPAITTHSLTSDASKSPANAITLDNTQKVMGSVIRILQRNHGTAENASVPPLVENLARLMTDLGLAASELTQSRTQQV